MRHDRWLDAFSEEDFDDPELAVVDSITTRVTETRRASSPAYSRARRIGAVVALAAAVALWVTWSASPITPGSEAVVQPLPDAAVVSQIYKAPDSRAAPIVAPEIRSKTPNASASPMVAVVERSEPIRLSGLEMHEAAVRLDGDAAWLGSGWLSYRHDATHDPGVRRVQLDNLPIELRPVGTAFTVGAQGQTAVIAVTEGTVEVHERDGPLLNRLAVGEELVLIPGDGENQVLTLPTTGLTIDQVQRLIPDHCVCNPRDVLASVGRLRLSLKEVSP